MSATEINTLLERRRQLCQQRDRLVRRRVGRQANSASPRRYHWSAELDHQLDRIDERLTALGLQPSQLEYGGVPVPLLGARSPSRMAQAI